MSGGVRFGVRAPDGEFAFDCSHCGGVAARLAVADGSEDVDGGPLPGGERLLWRSDGRPALRLEFLGVRTGSAPQQLIDLAAGSDSLDPLEVSAIDSELGAFCCRTCELNYCAGCWTKRVRFDERFYDHTTGRCPQGHEQELDD